MKHKNSLFSPGLSGITHEYVKYVRPGLGKLLRGMNIDLEYTGGEGDYLFAKIGDTEARVLDLTWGYGANLLGHNNPEIKKEALKILEEKIPEHVQGSIRRKSSELGAKLDELLTAETGKGNWVTHFSNSGAEAVETALKLSMYHFSNRIKVLSRQSIECRNQVLMKIDNDELSETQINALNDTVESLLKTYNVFTQPLENKHEMRAGLKLIFEMQLKKLESLEPLFGALEGGFHGKTLGALEVMGSSSHIAYMKGLNKRSIFAKDLNDLERKFQESLIDIYFIDLATFEKSTEGFSLFSAMIVEAIQGEGGIYPQNLEFLKKLRSLCQQKKVLFIADEIQSGLFRTGKLACMSNFEVVPDVYLFAKGLGGGIAKIGATVISQKTYLDDFGVRNTSTFSEDHFSSSIALHVLNTIGEDLKKNVHESGELLVKALNTLKEEHPDAISDVRGQGFMVGLELKLDFFNDLCLDTQLFFEQGLLSYFLSGVLLHKESIRLAPSLANQNTFRIEPSLHFCAEDISKLQAALTNLIQAAKEKDLNYFFPESSTQKKEKASSKLAFTSTEGTKLDAVFLCHLIDTDHCKQLLESVAHKSQSEIAHQLYDLEAMQSYTPVHTDWLEGANKKRIRYSLLSIPYTSEEFVRAMSKGNRDEIVQKIQNAVDFAKRSGAKTVGLGQFNSIITNNGLSLHNRGMNITTGNSFTVSLTVQAILQKMEERGMKPEDTSIFCLGAAGNIMSMIARLMVPHCKKMTLFNRTSLERSLPFQKSLKQVAQTILTRQKNKIENLSYEEILNLAHVKNKIAVSQDLNEAKKHELVICGTSSTKAILGAEHIQPGSLIVDVSVPSNLKTSIYEVPEVEIIRGGQARLPQIGEEVQSINTHAFPLKSGETFACMAETFALALSDEVGRLHVGEVTPKMVERASVLAKSAGIELGSVNEVEVFEKIKKLM